MDASLFMLFLFVTGAAVCFVVAFRLFYLARKNCFIWRVERPTLGVLALLFLSRGIEYLSYATLRYLRVTDGDAAGAAFSKSPAYLFVEIGSLFIVIVFLVALWLYPQVGVERGAEHGGSITEARPDSEGEEVR